MRIAYSCHDSFPSAATNTQQTFWTVFEVARLGVSVDLIIPSATGEPASDPAALAAYYGAQRERWPPTLRISALGSAPLNGSVRKGWFDWGIARHLRDAADPVDVVWTRDPLAALSCVRAGLPTIFETYRPDYATRGVFRAWRTACLDSPFLRGVIAHSALAAGAYQTAGVAADRILVAHNGFAPSLLEPRFSREDARQHLGLPDADRLLVYTGHTGPDKGLDTLIDLASDVPSVRLVIVGAAPESDDGRRLQQAAQRAGATNVLLRPRVPLTDVARYLFAADCLVIPPTEAPLRQFRRTVLPMKTFTYLAAGRPILAAQLPDVEEVLTNGETALLVPPDDRGEAARTLVALMTDLDLQARLATAALAASADYTWAARAKRILRFLDGV